jgi:hypothetical protein
MEKPKPKTTHAWCSYCGKTIIIKQNREPSAKQLTCGCCRRILDYYEDKES